MATLYILVGPPCIGKTTLARKMQEYNPHIKRVSFDDERRWFHGVVMIGNHHEESVCKDIAYTKTRILLDHGYDVVLDNNHLHQNTIDRIVKQFNTIAHIKIKPLPPMDLDVLLTRNAQRHKDTGVHVPESYIRKAHAAYQNMHLTQIDFPLLVN